MKIYTGVVWWERSRHTPIVIAQPRNSTGLTSRIREYAIQLGVSREELSEARVLITEHEQRGHEWVPQDTESWRM